MSIINTIGKRHSYRGKYKSDPVPREDLITIMKAGLDAPSGCNNQTTSLIAVEWNWDIRAVGMRGTLPMKIKSVIKWHRY